MTTKVYKYGLRAPSERGDEIRHLMRQGHRLRNQLVEIENAYRWARRQLFADLPQVQAVEALEKEWEEFKIRIRLSHEATCSKKLPPELAEAKTELLARLRAARAAAKPARAARMDEPAFVVDSAAMDARLKQMRYAVYKASGVTPGVRAIVTESIQASIRSLKPWQDLRFSRIDGARLTVAVTSPVRPSFWGITPTGSSRGGRRQFAELRLRIGSHPDRSAVWGKWPMVLHRPLPPGKIAQVGVTMTPEANRERWNAMITVVESETRKPSHGIGTVYANLGWRQREDGMRVLYTTDGETEQEFILPERIPGQLNRSVTLRSTRAQAMNVMAAEVVPLLSTVDPPVPWWGDATKTAHQWRSPRRWHRLFERLRAAGHELLLPQLFSWYHHDIHLWQWESGARRKALNSRKDFFRCVGAALARRYDTLVLTETPRAVFARELKSVKAVANNRVKVASHELELALIQAFASRQGTVQILPPDQHTRTCHACREVCDFDAAAHVEHTCEHCGAHWDQDYNHCRNLEHHYRERPGEAKTKGGHLEGRTVKNTARRDRMEEGAKIKQERINAARAALSAE